MKLGRGEVGRSGRFDRGGVVAYARSWRCTRFGDEAATRFSHVILIAHVIANSCSSYRPALPISQPQLCRDLCTPRLANHISTRLTYPSGSMLPIVPIPFLMLPYDFLSPHVNRFHRLGRRTLGHSIGDETVELLLDSGSLEGECSGKVGRPRTGRVVVRNVRDVEGSEDDLFAQAL